MVSFETMSLSMDLTTPGWKHAALIPAFARQYAS